MVSHSTGMLHSTAYGPHSACVCWQFSQYVCVLVMVSHSTCVCWQFSQYVCVLVMLSYSMCVCWQFFTVRVCTGYVLPQHVCVLALFTVRVYTGYVVLQHVCVLAVFYSTCVYWLCSPTARVCAGSFAVHVCILVMVSHSTCVC